MSEELEPNDQELPIIDSFDIHDHIAVGYDLTTTDVRTDDGQYVILGELDPRNGIDMNITGNSTAYSDGLPVVPSESPSEYQFESDQYLIDDMSDFYSDDIGDTWSSSAGDSAQIVSSMQNTALFDSSDSIVPNTPTDSHVSDQELEDIQPIDDYELQSTNYSFSTPTNVVELVTDLRTTGETVVAEVSSDQQLPDYSVVIPPYTHETTALHYEDYGQTTNVSNQSSTDYTHVSFIEDDDTVNSVLVVSQDNSVNITINQNDAPPTVDVQPVGPISPQHTHTIDFDDTSNVRPDTSEPKVTPAHEPISPSPSPLQPESPIDSIVGWFNDLWTSFSEYVEDVWNDWTSPMDSSTTPPYPTFTGPDSETIAGEPNESMEHWELQNRPDTCAVVAQMMVIEELTGRELSQDDVVRVAENAGVYVDGMGTPQELLGEVIEAYGLKTETINDASISDIESHLNKGEKMIVAVRADDYWNPDAGALDEQLYKSLGLPDPGANHCVEVIGIDRSDPQHPQVIVNDPGHPDGKGMSIPLDQFEDAWANSNNLLVTAHA